MVHRASVEADGRPSLQSHLQRLLVLASVVQGVTLERPRQLVILVLLEDHISQFDSLLQQQQTPNQRVRRAGKQVAAAATEAATAAAAPSLHHLVAAGVQSVIQRAQLALIRFLAVESHSRVMAVLLPMAALQAICRMSGSPSINEQGECSAALRAGL